MKLLVIEDDATFEAAAVQGLEGHELTVARTFEEAKAALSGGKKWDGVITDLFFPEAYGVPCGDEASLLIDLLESPQGLWSQDYDERSRYQHLAWKSHGEPYAPLGLKVIGLALSQIRYGNVIPVVGLSEGDRHAGALRHVRSAGRAFGLGDLLTTLVHGTGDAMSKVLPETWVWAVESLRPEKFLENYLKVQQPSPEGFEIMTGLREQTEPALRRWIGYRDPDGGYQSYGIVPEGYDVHWLDFPRKNNWGNKRCADKIFPECVVAIPHGSSDIPASAGLISRMEGAFPVGSVFWSYENQEWHRNGGGNGRYAKDCRGEDDVELSFDAAGQIVFRGELR